jgi:hypothetical protein
MSCCRPRASYLGHVSSEQRVETDPNKKEKINMWPGPCNIDKPRKFLGFSGYYQQFVQDRSEIAASLYELLGGSRIERNVKDLN